MYHIFFLLFISYSSIFSLSSFFFLFHISPFFILHSLCSPCYNFFFLLSLPRIWGKNLYCNKSLDRKADIVLWLSTRIFLPGAAFFSIVAKMATYVTFNIIEDWKGLEKNFYLGDHFINFFLIFSLVPA